VSLLLILLCAGSFTGQLAHNTHYNLIGWGDSNTAPSTHRWVNWTEYTLKLEDITYFSKGFSGYGCLAILATFNSEVLPNYEVGAFCIVLAGLNDDNGTNTPDSIYKWVTMLCDTASAHGFTTLVCTYPMQQNIMYQVNDLIQTNWASFADGIIDQTADAYIGESSNHSDGAYWDNIYHWSSGGHQRFAELYVVPKVREFL